MCLNIIYCAARKLCKMVAAATASQTWLLSFLRMFDSFKSFSTCCEVKRSSQGKRAAAKPALKRF